MTLVISHSAAAQEVDENLFLTRLLETHYTQWPVNYDDPQQFAIDLRELRDEMIRVRTYIQSQPDLDQRLVESYDEALVLLNAHRVTVGELTGINIDLNAEAIQDNVAAGVKAVASGFASGEPVLGSVVGGISLVTDLSTSGPRREHNAQMRIEAIAQAYQDQATETLMRAQIMAKAMTQKYGWGQLEAGFELSTDQAAAVQHMWEQGDLKGLLTTARVAADNKPRDPFIRLAHLEFKTLNHADDAQVLAQCAREAHRLGALIPPPSVYDDYRYDTVLYAAIYAMQARSIEVASDIVAHGSTPASRYSVELWRELLALTPHDTTGVIKMYLSWALMADGLLDEAIRSANQAPQSLQATMDYAYQYACLMSRRKQADTAIDWLRHAIKNGFWEMDHIRHDPDLDYVRSTRSQAFVELTNPAWTWSFSNDWVWDDITLTNTSLFPLTSITLQVSLVKGENTEQVTLQHDALMPGETYTWIDAVSGVSGEWDSASTASLVCDQNP